MKETNKILKWLSEEVETGDPPFTSLKEPRGAFIAGLILIVIVACGLFGLSRLINFLWF